MLADTRKHFDKNHQAIKSVAAQLGVSISGFKMGKQAKKMFGKLFK